MKFGLFIPQGWRFDLVGIDPADQWTTMKELALHADSGEAWESVWVYGAKCTGAANCPTRTSRLAAIRLP
jgi:hypothetical protein